MQFSFDNYEKKDNDHEFQTSHVQINLSSKQLKICHVVVTHYHLMFIKLLLWQIVIMLNVTLICC